MNAKMLFSAALIALAGLAAGIGTAQEGKDAKPAAKQEPKLPPGWTLADMQACMLAATPGKMHEHLAKDIGVWQGKNTMWMAPGADPIQCESTTTITALMDGRFIKSEMAGEMPGMGPYRGQAFFGFDNVSQKFSSAWIDNMGTGMAIGEGELSPDGKTMNWSFTYNCPIAKKPVVMRQVETVTGPSAKTIEMFSTDPKSGKEFKMMRIELTRK
jgi:hypothetical protein